MQLINDFKGFADEPNMSTVEAVHMQNGIAVPHLMVFTSKRIPAGEEALL